MVETVPSFLRKTPEPFTVTTRELEVLNGVANGLTHVQIGETLGIAYRTVNSHLDKITFDASSKSESFRKPVIIRAIASGVESGDIIVLDVPTGARLTGRESTICGLIRRGMDVKEAADFLVLSPKTTEAHYEHIYSKLRANNFYHAFAKLVSIGTQESRQRVLEVVR